MSIRGSLPGNRLDRLYSPPEIGAPGKQRAHSQRRDLLLAGGFVLAMGLAAVGAAALMMPGLFGRAYHLEAYFKDAEGLDVGMQVLQSGYVIGLVERVTPVLPENGQTSSRCPGDRGDGIVRPCFRALLSIKHDWPIPRDSKAQLGSEGLLKGDAIKVLPGTSEVPIKKDGTAEIQVTDREATLMSQLDSIADTLKRLVEESIAPTIESIQAQIKTLETLMGSGEQQGENRERLAGTFENLKDLTGKLSDSVDPQAIADILRSVQKMSDDLAIMTAELRGSTGEIQDAVTSYGDLAVDVQGLVKENRPALQKSLEDTQYLLQELSASLTPILTNIEDATRNLSALARELRNDPKSILKSREIEDQSPWFK